MRIGFMLFNVHFRVKHWSDFEADASCLGIVNHDFWDKWRVVIG